MIYFDKKVQQRKLEELSKLKQDPEFLNILLYNYRSKGDQGHSFIYYFCIAYSSGILEMFSFL